MFALAIGQLQLESITDEDTAKARKIFRGRVLNIAISNEEYNKQREENVADTPFGFS
jgi:two-component sensor histidine kinase